MRITLADAPLGKIRIDPEKPGEAIVERSWWRALPKEERAVARAWIDVTDALRVEEAADLATLDFEAAREAHRRGIKAHIIVRFFEVNVNQRDAAHHAVLAVLFGVSRCRPHNRA